MKRPANCQVQGLLSHCESGLFAVAEANALSLTQALPADQFAWRVLGGRANVRQEAVYKPSSLSLSCDYVGQPTATPDITNASIWVWLGTHLVYAR